MKLLASWMNDLGRYVSREFYYLMQDLIHEHQWRQVEPWMLVQPPELMKANLLQLVGEIPEVVLFWESYDQFNWTCAALRDLGCRLALFADDLHTMPGREAEREAKLAALSQCDVILSSYSYLFDQFYPELRGRKNAMWAPHAASPDFVLPFNPQPEDAVLLSGCVNSFYPLRMQMKTLHEREGGPRIAWHRHPGYGERFDYENDARVGSGYARLIHRYRAGFTDGTFFGYTVAKHFEIPATGALLIADGGISEPLRNLGFIEDIHYISVSAENLEEKLRCVLNEKKRAETDEIRRRGQQLVLGSHRTADRARFIDQACAAK
jgi:hypothetical protein